MTDIKYDAIIIGGGAAGCFAALALSERGIRTAVIERNDKLMRKLGITGKGRCNLTNNSDNTTIMKNIPKNPSFMYSALANLSSADVIEKFEKLGVPLKTERGNRVFPVSDKAGDIVNALRAGMQKNGVSVFVDKALSILVGDNGAVCGVKCEKSRYLAENVILATGGKSYPATGSDGSGYALASALGHTITTIKPSLVPVVTDGDCEELMGLSLRNVRLTLRDNKSKKGKPLFSDMGEMLFTHFGISGPLVLSASSYITSEEEGRYSFQIDLKPALDEVVLDKRIQRDFAENINRQLKNSLSALLPERLIMPVIKRSGIDPEKPVNSITKEERGALLSVIKGYMLNFLSFRPIDEAIITDGGISVKEINPKTMESRLVSGLFFAGEIIDVTGFTGGFNLQIAFSTAYSAALAISEKGVL